MKENNGNEKTFSRRSFLKTAALAGAGMMLSNGMTGVLQAAEPQQKKGNGDMNPVAYPPVLTQKRVLGSGDAALEVSALSLGCMGMNVLRGLHPDEKSMIRLIRHAYERGCNFFDTAEGYGPYLNEELLGKAVAPFRDRVVIATKFSGDYSVTPSRNDNSPRRIRAACEASLRRLKVEAIDLYYQHRIDRSVPMAEVADTVARLMQEGKVKHWGVSELNARHICEAHAVCPLTAVESEYHLMFRKPEQEIFPTLQELGIGMVAYSPLWRGYFGNTLTEYSDLNTNDIRGSWPQFTPEAIRANTRIVEALTAFGKTRGMTTAQVALAWMLHKFPFVVPLFGTTKFAHLEEDLHAVDFSLSTEDIRQIEETVSAYPLIGARYDAFNQAKVEY